MQMTASNDYGSDVTQPSRTDTTGEPMTDDLIKTVPAPRGGVYLSRSASRTHADYPHTPGTLYDCAACEQGDCVCAPGDAGCVSEHCGSHDRAVFDDPAGER